MNHHSELLNYIATKIGAKRYLEIGVYNPTHNFDKIQVEHKIGVDPDPGSGATLHLTSDRFFELFRAFGATTDLTLIDGLHYNDQVERDITGAWMITRPGGVIVLHDCNPPTEATTCIPRGAQREWCGDVYQAIARIENPFFFTINFDYGCAVIRKTPPQSWIAEKYGAVDVYAGDSTPTFRKAAPLTWAEFESDRQGHLHLVDLEKGLKMIDQWT